jgi:hypothetical protein
VRISPLKTRNSDIRDRYRTIQSAVKDRTAKNYEQFISNEKRRREAMDQKAQQMANKKSWTDDPYILLKEELEKRREKYTILSRSGFNSNHKGESRNSLILHDATLQKSIEHKL